ncbi:MAG: hypothetical protein FWC89_06235 [Defluviitaleaceae bacterium]|nr:hypothetical protein [Defluviitaleaceae bacterium]
MSVAAIIINPKDIAMDSPYIPLATENFFCEYWIPVINELELKWIACFQSGIDITRDDLPFILDELEKIKPWISENYPVEAVVFMVSRIDHLVDALREIICDDGVIVFIG